MDDLATVAAQGVLRFVESAPHVAARFVESVSNGLSADIRFLGNYESAANPEAVAVWLRDYETFEDLPLTTVEISALRDRVTLQMSSFISGETLALNTRRPSASSIAFGTPYHLDLADIRFGARSHLYRDARLIGRLVYLGI